MQLNTRCCGCGACVARCPKGCLAMCFDSAGFPYPEFKPISCVGCGACDKICPVLNNRPTDKSLDVYWARARSEELLKKSSSGGLFGLLAGNVIANGGIVVGAAFDNDVKSVRHIAVTDGKKIEDILRSKYVQSILTKDIYEEMRSAIVAGRRVLFAGTACQVAGVRGYLGKYAESNLFVAIDVICHGVPSPKLWSKWVDYRALCSQLRISGVNFRSKKTGWSSYSVLYYGQTEDGKSHVIGGRYSDDWYMRAFLSNASLRESCFDCPSKRSCGSDITLGDFWGFQSIHPEIDVSDGMSVVICNTEKGKCLFECVCNEIESGPACYAEILTGNPALEKTVTPYPRKKKFMEAVCAGVPITQLVNRFDFQDTILQRLKQKIQRIFER